MINVREVKIKVLTIKLQTRLKAPWDLTGGDGLFWVMQGGDFALPQVRRSVSLSPPRLELPILRPVPAPPHLQMTDNLITAG